jgi:hypothetical protein
MARIVLFSFAGWFTVIKLFKAVLLIAQSLIRILLVTTRVTMR